MEIAVDTTSLVETLKANIGSILESHPIKLAYLYGSAAAGHSSPLSDVDIALVADRDLIPRDRLKLMLEVEVEVADRCDIRNADVRIINDAPLIFKGRVACDGVLLYARDQAARIEFETTTRDAYFDYLPVHRRLQEAFFADVRGRGLHGRPRQS